MKKLAIIVSCICIAVFSTGCKVKEETAKEFARDISLMVQQADTDVVLKTYGNLVSPEVSAKIAGAKANLEAEGVAVLEDFGTYVMPDTEGENYTVYYYGYRLQDFGNSSWVLTSVRVEDGVIDSYETELLFGNQLHL